MRKPLLKLARVAWLVFFFTGLLGGVDYLFSRNDLSLGLFMGGLATAGLPWSVFAKVMPEYGVYLLFRGLFHFGAAFLNYRWIMRELRRVDSAPGH